MKKRITGLLLALLTIWMLSLCLLPSVSADFSSAETPERRTGSRRQTAKSANDLKIITATP